jgi:lysyl-tRNA synthetase class I
LPAEASTIGDDERAFLAQLAGVAAASTPASGDAWQAAIFTTAKAAGLPTGRAFATLYLVFLGRPNGPRAGWLLAGLEPGFVIGRLREAAGDVPAGATR